MRATWHERATMFPTASMLFEKLPRMLRRHRLMTAWMKLTGEPELQLVRVRDNSFAYADLSDGFLRLIVIDGHFEEDFFRIADALLATGGVFFDVGANYGLLSFGLAGRYGERIDFHLFEPNTVLVDAIKRSKALYPAMRCTVTGVAVSDQEGLVSFLINDAQTGVSHVLTEDSIEQGGKLVKAPCVVLDKYFETVAIDRVDLLKLDIEGHELKALRGAARALESRRIQAVYFEYFEKWLRRVQPPEELLAFLQSHDYQVCICRKDDFEARGGASHTIAAGLPGHRLPLLPIGQNQAPEMTDLLAIPAENLVKCEDVPWPISDEYAAKHRVR